MPKNNVTNVICSNTPYYRCPCGYEKTFERACDIKKGVARHSRFCDVAKSAMHMDAKVFAYTRESGQHTITTTTVTPAMMKVGKK